MVECAGEMNDLFDFCAMCHRFNQSEVQQRVTLFPIVFSIGAYSVHTWQSCLFMIRTLLRQAEWNVCTVAKLQSITIGGRLWKNMQRASFHAF